MEFPSSVTDDALLSQLKVGTVLKAEVVFPDGEKSVKRLIVVSNQNEELTLVLTTTTNLHYGFKYYRKDDIYLMAGQEGPFEIETCVQMNRVLTMETKAIKEKYNRRILVILGKISDDLISRIYDGIDKSELIDQKHVKRILSERIK